MLRLQTRRKAMIALVLGLWMSCHLAGNAQQRPQRVTQLRVTESSFGEETRYTITADSIQVRRKLLLEEGAKDTLLSIPLDLQRRDWLLASFDKIYLSSLQSKYEGPSLHGHSFGYHLVIYKGEHLAVTDLYKYRLDAFFTFCQRLNQLLPEVYQIHYTANYFKPEY
ncbi:hypothetical protein F0P96_04570 [Hymenobacter busanensis]|uniref:Uncharacterized protein n=1 Tax=Hymenobacter busanensis TaxID=2607656 RepID=A0A7L5A2B9_9BACT|nr:hypothetical protein [Hymenobacter busanensis]KAA9338129.1 hypothetical protein F0P96_04570 [Hymenobacter busanensis]QHJ09447.1 hypothetical protein GUY19_20035 [Hymenobacter busanensis]